MRLLIVDQEFPPNPHGGIGSYNFELAHLLGRRGHFVAVLTGTEAASPKASDEAYGVLIQVPFRPGLNSIRPYLRWITPLSFWRQVMTQASQVVDQYKIDIVEVPSAGGYGAFLAHELRSKVPVVTRFHGSLGKIPIDDPVLPLLEAELQKIGEWRLRRQIAAFANSPQWLLEREQIRRSKQITCPSEFSRRWLLRQIRLAANKLTVIPNGIDLDGFSSYQAARRERRSDRRLIVFAGRCSVSKGITVLIRVLPKVLSVDPGADMLFAGPVFDPRISRQLDRLSELYPGRIIRPGRLPRENYLTWLSKSHLLVHPSFYEISPMAVLEAMALGVPVAAAGTGPLPEIVVHQETGLLFEPGDEESLASAVLSLLSQDRYALDRMGAASIHRIETNFNLHRMSEELVALYNEMIEIHKGRSDVTPASTVGGRA